MTYDTDQEQEVRGSTSHNSASPTFTSPGSDHTDEQPLPTPTDPYEPPSWDDPPEPPPHQPPPHHPDTTTSVRNTSTSKKRRGSGKNSKKRTVTKAIADFFKPAPKRPTSDQMAQMNPAARKRAVQSAKRKQRIGVRYSGDRWKMVLAGLLIVGLIAFIPATFIVANSKVSKDDLQQAVAQQMAQRGSEFPTGQAAMWAGQVVKVWATWHESKADKRAVLIAPYLSQGMDEQAGWNGQGNQTVTFVSINPDPTVIDKHHALVHAVYQTKSGTWRCVALPIYAYHPKEMSGTSPWAFALSANPVPTTCTPRTGAPSADMTAGKDTVNDSQTAGDLAHNFFPGFFAAWAASDRSALTQYTAPGTTIVGLGGAMASTPPPQIGDVVLPVGQAGVKRGKTYHAIVPVTWTVAGSSSEVTATYKVPIRKEGDRWYVTGDPQAAPQTRAPSGGAPANIPQPHNAGG